MHRVVTLYILCMLCLAMILPRICLGADSHDMPPRGTPQRLLDAWLDFHDAHFCQDIDAVFAFYGDGMEIWCVVENEKQYRKFRQMLEPLRESYRIELYATDPPKEEKSDRDETPPPSLWENTELRAYLGDRYESDSGASGFGISAFRDPFPSGYLLTQRLLIFANQTLERNRNMERYAMDLPALTGVALDPTMAPEIRHRASLISLEHAEEMSEQIKKLNENLSRALPELEEKDSEASQRDALTLLGKTPAELASLLAEKTHAASRRVYHFIYPESYTVGLDELRDPSLLNMLEAMRIVNEEFQRAMNSLVQSQR